ncbi:MAG: hydroxysqualene dehydroxylase HpnE [Melioribacteraceae bacterium]
MKRAIVIGGGFSGLSASVYLAENNFEVTLLEASPKLGGRAYSITGNPGIGTYDNGQHILMGCYDETIAFLKKINSYEKLNIQKSLSIPFVKSGGEILTLSAGKYLYPFNLLSGILNYKALSLKERFKVIDFFLDLVCCYSCDLKEKSVRQWLECKKQSDNSIRSLWEILVVGTLNTTIDKASAETFSEILKTIFLTGNSSATVILPAVGLTRLYCDDAAEFIKNRGGKIHLSEKAVGIETDGNRLTKLITEKCQYEEFDSVVFAIPAYALEKLVWNPGRKLAVPQFNYSPIVNVHLWLRENPFKEEFYGLIGSKIHWVFNHGRHITLMTSSADFLVGDSAEKIVENFVSELEKYFPIFRKEIISGSKVIKEKRATFIPDVSSNEMRGSLENSIEKMFVAGDWTDTGLPSTIESAVLSGRLAAQEVITSLN